MSSIVAFTPEQACRVSGLSKRQLSYWDKTGLFHPKFADDAPRHSRMYSFRDVVGLRTIAMLREHLPLQELRRVGEWLHARYDEPWAELQFTVVGRKVIFEGDDGVPRVAGTDQVAIRVMLSEVANDTERASIELLGRRPDQIGAIVRNRTIQHNSWVVDGTRITTSAIYDFFRAGFAPEAIQREYPRLTLADIQAAIAFEADRAQKAS